jgi:hypothetical protein
MVKGEISHFLRYMFGCLRFSLILPAEVWYKAGPYSDSPKVLGASVMPLANTIILPCDLIGSRRCDSPARAPRFTGPVSRRKAVDRSSFSTQPLHQSGSVPFLRAILPIRTVNSLNTREHWGTKSTRAKRERNQVRYELTKLQPLPALPWVVVLTRIGKGTRPMDDDGLAASLKHIRDEVAACAGVDDGKTTRITFRCAQQRGETYGVVVVISQTNVFQDSSRVLPGEIPAV